MIAIFDIGKTNKKCFVFDEDYRIVFETTTTLPETVDEDGEPCEDLALLRNWVWNTFLDILADEQFQIKAVNVTTYGASLVHVDEAGMPLTPLYNYLKSFPEALQKQFYARHDSSEKLALETASPALGMLNSGLQLYWLKHYQPLVFNKIKWSLHLPQFVAALLHQQYFSEMTSIGCHTMLWDFRKNDYHDWVKAEYLTKKFPPIQPASSTIPITSHPSGNILSGTGLHDSSAALIPYLASFEEPFVLISTGTWCISLNPYNQETLTVEDLEQDYLCYLTYTGQPVKAARYFGGQEHETCIQALSQDFNQPLDYYKGVAYNPIIYKLLNQPEHSSPAFENYETAYHAKMSQLMKRQYNSTKMVLTEQTKRIFVDGGFSKNEIYMQLLADVFPHLEVYAAEVAQATALGAALAMHASWNPRPCPKNLITLKKYTATHYEIDL